MATKCYDIIDKFRHLNDEIKSLNTMFSIGTKAEKNLLKTFARESQD